ncbi:unnamed protein product [Didymodactylos carnosus]|uniref:EF-hand domain-containing protein n=1 Tax=Didymodactylos carnosus TaxID=1234261 RepID=A0A813P5M4_9BILA|nr:unnamed protein product [Didymodactylos carnosus]CAF0750217.1 unnamed protein product [Didymodactylos carnosus]CAF3492982.1 unnamed protein product [Didymodactylos carnosus]CAF3529643.1 unnamed protein product [Didymodactylos carnosus]
MFLELTNCSGRISIQELHFAVKALKLDISDDDTKALFRQFDTTKNGQIDLKEFIRQLRPEMNDRRLKAALNIFNSTDINKDGVLTISDLRALRNFFNKFDTYGQKNGEVGKDEFLGFCSMLSTTIKEDIYFEHILRTIFDFRI